MGMFDTFDGADLKVGPRDMAIYKPGDAVPIEDGVYLAWEGIVVIHEGRLIRSFPSLLTKWGEEISAERALHIIDSQLTSERIAARSALAEGA